MTGREHLNTTPAEERAAREGMPVVLLVPLEALRIAEGNPLVASTIDGREVLVRLATADEFHAKHVAACREYGLIPSPLAEIEKVVRPVKLP